MYIITFIVYVLYVFNVLSKSFRILTYDLNNANVFSFNFIISFAWF